MKDFYERDNGFKEYVDSYCVFHKCTVDEALNHVLVQEVYKQYVKTPRTH